MKLIEKLIEPKKLLIIWQAPGDDSNQPAGTRFVVGEIVNDGARARLRYYNNKEVETAIHKGFNGLTAYPYEPDKDFNGNLVDILSKRLPPKSRGDYDDYLRSHRISPTADGITILSLLAYTSGKLEGDGFSFAHAFEEAEAPFDYAFEIAGFRYHQGMDIKPITSLQNSVVDLKIEADNKHDKDAIVVLCKGHKLGYVPKGLNSVLKKFMSTHKVTAFITKINGTLQKPNILVYLEIAQDRLRSPLQGSF